MAKRTETVEHAGGMTMWISVKDRVPETGLPVLAWYAQNSQKADRQMAVVATYGDRFPEKWVTQVGKIMVRVTHWMPLPSPPT